MARRKRRQRNPAAAAEHIGLHEAAVLLQKLRELGHLTAAHLREARTAVVREVEEITERLAQLKEMAHVPASSRKAPKSAEERPRVRKSVPVHSRKRKPPVSAEHRKVMVLQGRYLGLGHKIPKGELAMFKSMISKVGKAEVVERMQAYVSAHQSKGDGPFPVKRGAGRKRRSRKK